MKKMEQRLFNKRKEYKNFKKIKTTEFGVYNFVFLIFETDSYF